MHLIIGFALASLLGLKQKPSPSPLLVRHGPVRTEHLLPGRVRFRVDALRGNPHAARRVLEQMPKLEGIHRVSASDVTGGVLVLFNPSVLEPALIFTALIKVLGLEHELAGPRPLVARELREAASALNRSVYEQSGGLIDLWTALPLLLAAAGIGKLIRDGATASLPGGFTLIWWAYVSLIRNSNTPQ